MMVVERNEFEMDEKIADTLSRSVQDYLKTIYSLSRRGEPIGTVELAESLNVAPASVSNMFQKLDIHTPPLVEYQKGRGVTLTQDGEQAALMMIRRHRLLEQFLYEVLGYSWEMVHQEAEELEHVISPYMEDRIAALLGEPQFDPHGDPIPNRQLELFHEPGIVPLGELMAGESGVVRQLDASRLDLVDFFVQIGVKIGVRVRVLQRNPIDSVQRIALEGAFEEHVIGTAISAAILVNPD